VKRKVRKDGTVSYQGKDFEVPYELSGKTVQLVVDPHAGTVMGIEDADGNALGSVTSLDVLANAHRRRRKPDPEGSAPVARPLPARGPNLVELAYQQHHRPPAQEDR
jgi:hypothetical protein